MANQIDMYSLPTCPYCIKTKDYLASKEVPYIDHNVFEDPVERQALLDKTGAMKVPATIIDGEIVIGFDKNRLDKLLGLE